jgi:ADP-ribosylglycohydrolase
MGMTTYNAVSQMDIKDPDITYIKKQVEIKNPNSQSNGSLMRITPMAIWAHNLPEEDIDKAVRAETTLTHYNETVQRVCVCYCICIKYLILSGKEDGKEAIAKVK